MNGRRVVTLAVALLMGGLILSQGALGQNGGNSVQASAQVSNEPPVNLRISIAGDEDAGTPGVQLSPLASVARVITVTGTAEDGNGWQDLRSATLRVYTPQGPPLTSLISMVAGEGSGRELSWTGTFEMSAANAPGTYVVEIVVKDREDAEATAQTPLDWRGLLAFALESSSVSFGATLGPGLSSHASPAAVVVRNSGSVPIDVQITGTPLLASRGDASIPADRVRYSPVADMSNERSLSATGVLDTAFDLGPGLSKSAYFDLHVPTGDEQYVPADTYTGSIVIGGVVG